MTAPSPLVEGQVHILRRSLPPLLDACVALRVDDPIVGRLRELFGRLGVLDQAAGSPTPSASARQVLDLIAEARASASLMVSLEHRDGADLLSVLSEVEGALGRELRRGPGARVYGLYVIVDPEVTAGRDSLEIARGALKGGARVLQLRDKLREKGQTLPLARALRELCAERDALFIMNDHADLAVLVGADGLHVGQGDLPVSEARRILQSGQIVGRSNHLLDEVVESQRQGADHVALGAVYLTSTKASIVDRATLGPETVGRARKAVDVPLVAIGGITEDNLEPVVKAGADAICVTGAVGLATDPEAASRRLVEGILRAGGKA